MGIDANYYFCEQVDERKCFEHMVKRMISRKKFLSTAVAGLGGIKLLSHTLNDGWMDNSRRHSVGKTGILVSPVCFGAPRTNEESLIRYAVDKVINFIDTGRAYGNGTRTGLFQY